MPADEILIDPILQSVPAVEGYKVLGGVVLYQKLGQGGMGAVYRGKHLRLDVDVALKVMGPPAGITPSQAENYVARFLREARTAASVRHQNLIRVLDVNSESGVHFIIMDFIDGESAGDRLKRRGRLTEREAVEIALGAAEGLAAAHRAGIVHRDVKPDNILLDKDGHVVVADLGLAKAFGGETDSAVSMGLSLTQQTVGTPFYMSPEQTRSAKDVGPQADVWSLGVTIFQLVTSKLPWTDTDLTDLIGKIRNLPPPDIGSHCDGISPGLCALVHGALRKNPAERYSDCGEMAKALRVHLASLGQDTDATLADPEAGKTRLAIATMPTPPSKIISLIGVSMVEMDRVRDSQEMQPATARRPALGSRKISDSAPPYDSRTDIRRKVVPILALLISVGMVAWFFGVRGSEPLTRTTTDASVRQKAKDERGFAEYAPLRTEEEAKRSNVRLGDVIARRLEVEQLRESVGEADHPDDESLLRSADLQLQVAGEVARDDPGDALVRLDQAAETLIIIAQAKSARNEAAYDEAMIRMREAVDEGRYADAISALAKALALRPGDVKATLLLPVIVQLALTRAQELREQGNWTKAVEQYRLAADQGDAEAQFWLGFCYCYGKGVRQDYPEGVKWYRLAADQGHTGAQLVLELNELLPLLE